MDTEPSIPPAVFFDTANGARVATAGDLETPSAQVLLFKNGYAIVTRRIKLTTLKTTMGTMFEHTILSVPSNAVHGSFWILPTEESRANVLIHCTRTQPVEVPVTTPCRDFGDLILANVGNQVKVAVNVGNTVVYHMGTIKLVKEPAAPNRSSGNAYGSSAFLPATDFSGTVPPYYKTPTISDDHETVNHGNLVILQTADGEVAFPFTAVVGVCGIGSKFETQTVTKSKPTYGLCLTYSIADNTKPMEVDFSYITFGLTWAPSYHVTLYKDIQGLPKLDLSLKAVILNDQESLLATEVNCVAGVPNIKFSHILEPMTRIQAVSQFLESIGANIHQLGSPAFRQAPRQPRGILSNAYVPNIMSQQMAPSIMSQMPAQQSYGGGDDYDTPDADNKPPESKSGSDLHFYTFKNLILAKQSRVAAPIFVQTLPYKSIYVVDLSSSTISHHHTSSKFEDCYSAIEFRNTTGQVWTTAPITVFKNGFFVSQDSINYTPVGMETTVQLTKALDVVVKHEEYDVKHMGNEYWSHRNYRKDDVSGRFVIRHSKPEVITLIIKIKFEGKLVPTKGHLEPRNVMKNTSFWSPNETTTVTWEKELKVGEAYTLEYKRHFWH